MPELRPTNERLVELLEELLTEVRQLRDGQQQLAAEMRRLTESSRG
jgi:hypothetical protein